MEDLDNKATRRARRKRLIERLEALRERAYVLEEELKPYINDFFRVCIFGSARIKPDDDLYSVTERLAYYLGLQGIDVLTGGGPGLMEAANKGVQRGKKEAQSKSKSFGLPIEGGFEARTNEHLDIKHFHRRFSSRLDEFMRLSSAFVLTPGGIGTLLELFFSWQLLQVGHISERPIILLGKTFWSPLLDWMKDRQVGRGLISPGDFRVVSIVETPEEAMAIIKKELQKFIDRRAAQGLT